MAPDNVAVETTTTWLSDSMPPTDDLSFKTGGNGAGLTGDLTGLAIEEFFGSGVGEIGADDGLFGSMGLKLTKG